MMKSTGYKYHEYIDNYLNAIKNDEVVVGEYLKKLPALVEKELSKPKIKIDSKQIYETKRVIEEHSDITLFDWQLFVIGLMHCYYTDIPAVVFPEILLYMGRGAGKNKFVAELARYFTSPNHGVPRYNVDITANNETQAKISFMDLHGSLEADATRMKKIYQWNLMEITCKPTASKVKYHTSNARTKDGLRPGMVLFDEIHEYETYDTINVFTSALGKVPYDRTVYITTNGYVRGGVLDKELKKARDVLDGKDEGMGYLPLLYELDDDEEVHNEEMWNKANPSLKYLPGLRNRIQREYRNSERDSNVLTELMTKRMNRPRQKNYLPIAEWDLIEATNQPIPIEALEGLSCIGAIDYASIRDFCSVGLLFKFEGKRYWLEHTFVNKKALEIPSREIKFPVMEMVEKGLITIVYDETIRPETVVNWFIDKAQTYNIVNISADMHRATYLKQAFDDAGMPLEIVRSGPITHSKLSPLIESIFAEKTIVFGDSPTMRWYVNNTYKEFDKKGNVSYNKIEPILRKTDGFFALVHALVLDDEIQEEREPVFLGAITF
ncbi:MAG TPA: terminase TerL endonuclease subunit [Tissierellaceae bacterium]|nr:terminase TerL endonuclease subunit [Tissierellaceae bacterium]